MIEVVCSRDVNDLGPVKDLLARCVRGEQVAWEALYRRYADSLYRHLCVLVGPGPEAEDALQQTFLEAFRKLETFAGRSKLSTWFHSIAVRVALNILRSRKRRSRAMGRMHIEVIENDQGSTPETRVESRQQLAWLEHYLDYVSPEKRIAFLLYYVEQRDLQEVAQLMNTSPNTTLVRINRTRKKLMRYLERDERAREKHAVVSDEQNSSGFNEPKRIRDEMEPTENQSRHDRNKRISS